MPQGKQKVVRKLPTKLAFSAGGIVYKKTKAGVVWLLIKPKGTDRWQLPKGLIEKGESAKEAALREVYEETGIKAQVIEKIGDIKYFFVLKTERIFKTVNYYLMEYVSGKPTIFPEAEREIEEIAWMESSEALSSLSFKDERGVVEKGLASMEVVK